MPDAVKRSALPSPDLRFAQWVEERRRPILLLAAIMALVWTLLYLQFTVDDAYISFRYAKTLVAHHVWNWNPAGPHEEGYTSLTYTVLGIVPAVLHLPASIFFKLVGLLCVALMVYRVRKEAETPFAALLAILLIALNPFVWIHAYSGLETPLYMLLVLEMALCVKKAAKASPVYVYSLFLLLPLTRPEGLAFALLGVALFWKRRGGAPKHLTYFGATLALALVYFLLRWRYFHHMLPNPFYVKVAQGNSHQLTAQLAENLKDFRLYFLIALFIAWLGGKTYVRAFALCALLLVLLLFAPHIMPMNYADRFYFQTIFPVLLVFLLGENIAASARSATLVATLSVAAISVGYLSDFCLKLLPYMEQAHLAVGKVLAPYAKGHSVLIGDAGAMPYLSDWTTYDYNGLGTSEVAEHGMQVSFLEKVRPDLIVLTGPQPGPEIGQDPNPRDPQAVTVQYLKQSGDYDYEGSAWAQRYYLIYFLRKDTADHDAIATALKENAARAANWHFSTRDLLLQKYVPWHD